MPVHLLAGDRLHLKSMTRNIPKSVHHYVWETYQKVWMKAEEMESSIVKKENKGRHAANIWVREYVEGC